MPFTTISFTFVFLPLSLLFYYLAPRVLRTPVLLLISLLFYTLLDPTNLALMLLSISYDYLMAWLILRAKRDISLRKLPMIACVVKNLAMIVVFGLQQSIFHINMPLGLLVYSLTSMGYVIDVYRGDQPFEKNWFRFALFCCFFGKIHVGPLVQYGDMKQQLTEQKLSLPALSSGLPLFLSGLAKQVILAEGAGDMLEKLQSIPAESVTVVSTWLLILGYIFRMYFQLSGYCDMARGLAQLYSFRLPQSYYYPFQSRTVSDFFDRFNSTVTQYTNRYVYIMLGADSGGRLSDVLNTFLTAMLLGLWFGIDMNYLLWGCYFALFILLERYFLLKHLLKLPVIFLRAYTFAAVSLSFTIFHADSLKQAGEWLKIMFGFSGREWINGYASYILSANLPLLVLSFFCLTSLSSILARQFGARFPILSKAGALSWNSFLLLLIVAFIL